MWSDVFQVFDFRTNKEVCVWLFSFSIIYSGFKDTRELFVVENQFPSFKVRFSQNHTKKTIMMLKYQGSTHHRIISSLSLGKPLRQAGQHKHISKSLLRHAYALQQNTLTAIALPCRHIACLLPITIIKIRKRPLSAYKKPHCNINIHGF